MHKKAMVIDDMQLDRFVAGQILSKADFAEEVLLFESAEDGLDYLMSNEIAPEELPDVIFLDIQMPELNGFDFLDRFDKLPEAITRSCQIVMLSSSTDPRDMQKARERKRVKDYIIKPLNVEKLGKMML